MAKEAPPLLFAARLGSLVPVNAPARDAVKALAGAGDGRCRVEIKRSNANQRRRAFYWVMLDVVAETLSDATGSAWDAETLFRQERDDARTALGSLQKQLAAVTAELAPLKAARERANANLAAANAKRRSRAVANDAPLPPAA